MRNIETKSNQWLLKLIILGYQLGGKDKLNGIFIDEVDMARNLLNTYAAQENVQKMKYKPLILNDNIGRKPLQGKILSVAKIS